MVYTEKQYAQAAIRTAEALPVKWWHRRAVRVGALIGAGALVGLLLIGGILRTTLPLAPSFIAKDQPVNKPFVISLNQTIASVNPTDIVLSPRVEGSWSFKSGKVFGTDTLTFTPAQDFKANTLYTVKSIQAKRVLFSTERLSDVSFTTEAAPGVKSQGLALVKDNTVIAADTAFTVQLERPNAGLRDLQLKTIPEVATTKEVSGDTTYTWRPTDLLPQGQDLTIEVYDAKNKTTLMTKKVKVAAVPTITSVSKPSYFTPNDVQQLTFSSPIDPKTATITFSIDGAGEWKSPTVYTFTPKSIEPGKTYTYKVQEKLRSTEGGIAAAPLEGSFTTTGAVSVLKSSPTGQELSRVSQKISFTFDQGVDHESVASHFSISSGRVTDTSWSGNIFTAMVVDFGYQQTVTATIAAGVKNTGFGLPSSRPYSVVFTTEIRVVKYNVPFYRQQYAGSCTAASLRMILGYYSIGTDDMSIVQRMGYNPRSWDTSTDPPTWDDPDQMFVGDINGKIREGTGAGPDAGPVAKAAQSFGRNASAVTGVSAGWIAQQLIDGKLVVMFGSWNGSNSYVTWKTPSGRVTTMNATGHATAVVGVKGEPSNPQGFWVSDPLTGGTAYWSAAKVQANISLDPYRQAVVVW